MANYEVGQDLGKGTVICRVNGVMSDAETRALGTEMFRAIGQVRASHAAIRMLFVNQADVTIFSTDALRPLAEEMQRRRMPGDRTAFVVATSLDKLSVKQNLAGDSQVFISEAAAMLWLEAWQYKAA